MLITASELPHPLPKFFTLTNTRITTVHGKCRCGAGIRRSAVLCGGGAGALSRLNGQPHDFREQCTCGRFVRVSPLSATVKVHVKCSAICTGAKGHSCDCSCGGANHGSDHAA